MASAHAEFSFVLNGTRIQVSGVAPQVTLLDYVRARGLTGAKEGCAEGECGACAVLFVTESASGQAAYRSVNSCLVPLPAVADREVYTVEGLSEAGRLAEVQTAMMEHNGSQCGYCTPGFVVSMFAEHYRPDQGLPDPHALGGNLCRCTGYRPIRDAMLSLGPPPAGALRSRLSRPAPRTAPLEYRTPEGRFSRPQSLAECLRMAADDPASRFVAGNTDVGVVTNLRGQRCPHLISLESVPELLEFEDGPDATEIGAGLTLTAIGEYWKTAPLVFREWLPLFASTLIRNRATLGGNLATASPIGDAAPMLLALDAEVRIAGAAGERLVPLSKLFLAYRTTVLQPGEILRSIRIPKPLASDARFYKAAKRSLDDISTVAACFAVSRDEHGRIGKARFAYGGVAATPWRAQEAEQLLEGTFGEPDDVARARASLRETLHPIGDHRGSAEYRLALAQSLLDKFWFEQFTEVAA
jgi:xanthine dehydrogenase small subunit